MAEAQQCACDHEHGEHEHGEKEGVEHEGVGATQLHPHAAHFHHHHEGGCCGHSHPPAQLLQAAGGGKKVRSSLCESDWEQSWRGGAYAESLSAALLV